MKAFFKLTHIIVLASFIITGNDFYDQILGGIIAVIAYIYAFTFTRNISSGLAYNSILMSLVHWTIRTIVSVLMIIVTSPFYTLLKIVINITNKNTSEIVSVTICALIWIVLAEFLKSASGLNKHYW